MKVLDIDDRFGMPDSAFRSAQDSNPYFRTGLYVPTRREVMEQPSEWLAPILIDWFWECPVELIPSDAQIVEVKAILQARPDADSPAIAALVAECDDCTRSGR
ncbi:hypothetical protein [Xanthomonas massiliensis]|uniref:hypothetical protein n=1 Tax=Xanthomonas massiliensis TaxID=1720302 RepID=UPI00098EC83B|nr:hypothetical protein [Xanthomonas massiliensis]